MKAKYCDVLRAAHLKVWRTSSEIYELTGMAETREEVSRAINYLVTTGCLIKDGRKYLLSYQGAEILAEAICQDDKKDADDGLKFTPANAAKSKPEEGQAKKKSPPKKGELQKKIEAELVQLKDASNDPAKEREAALTYDEKIQYLQRLAELMNQGIGEMLLDVMEDLDELEEYRKRRSLLKSA